MIIGILSVRNHRYHPNRRLLEAAAHLHVEATLVHPGRVYLGAGEEGLIVGRGHPWKRPNVLLPRLGATIKEYGLTMIRHFQLMGNRVVNRFEAILLASNKFRSLQALSAKGIPVPETRYASNGVNFRKAVASLGGFPLVVKLPQGRQGTGVFLLDSEEEGKAVLEAHLNTGRGLLLQRYIGPEGRKDYRILVVGEKVVAAMALKPRRGDFRANVHLGGTPTAVEPDRGMSRLALSCAGALGLDIAGVDVIEDQMGSLHVIEVNASPGFKGLERCTGVDVAAEIIRYTAWTGGKV